MKPAICTLGEAYSSVSTNVRWHVVKAAPQEVSRCVSRWRHERGAPQDASSRQLSKLALIHFGTSDAQAHRENVDISRLVPPEKPTDGGLQKQRDDNHFLTRQC